MLAWTLIEAVRWELPAPMQEYALRWRWSRLEEYGFVGRDEARRVYLPLRLDQLTRPRPPAPLDAERAPHLPAVIADELGDEFAIARALTRADPRGERLGELGAILNRALVADGVEPGEPRAGRQAARRALGYMSVGLIYAAGSTEPSALADAVGRAALGDLLRAGHTAAAALARQAALLAKRPALTIIEGMEHSLLSDADAALFEGLARARPTYAGPGGEPALFCEVAQIEECAARLGRIASVQLWVFAIERATLDDLVRLARRPDAPGEPYDVTLEALGATWLARSILGGATSFEPLGAPELAALAAALGRGEGDAAADALVRSADVLPAQATALLGDWARRAIERLKDEFGSLVGAEPEPALFSGVLLTRAD